MIVVLPLVHYNCLVVLLVVKEADGARLVFTVIKCCHQVSNPNRSPAVLTGCWQLMVTMITMVILVRGDIIVINIAQTSPIGQNICNR